MLVWMQVAAMNEESSLRREIDTLDQTQEYETQIITEHAAKTYIPAVIRTSSSTEAVVMSIEYANKLIKNGAPSP